MTLRELLKELQAQDEKSLDTALLVSPASGGYSGISHLSVCMSGMLFFIPWIPQS
jgi:hypothetical protein